MSLKSSGGNKKALQTGEVVQVPYKLFVIPTAVKRARALISARVGRRDLAFSFSKKSKLHRYQDWKRQ